MDVQSPQRLYQAHAALQQRAAQLFQDGAWEWWGAVQRLGAVPMPDRSPLDGARQVGDRQAAGNPAPWLFWGAFDDRLGNAHALQEVAFRSQLMFAMEMRQAVLEWQQNVLDAVGDGAPGVCAATGRRRSHRNGTSPARAANDE